MELFDGDAVHEALLSLATRHLIVHRTGSVARCPGRQFNGNRRIERHSRYCAARPGFGHAADSAGDGNGHCACRRASGPDSHTPRILPTVLPIREGRSPTPQQCGRKLDAERHKLLEQCLNRDAGVAPIYGHPGVYRIDRAANTAWQAAVISAGEPCRRLFRHERQAARARRLRQSH